MLGRHVEGVVHSDGAGVHGEPQEVRVPDRRCLNSGAGLDDCRLHPGIKVYWAFVEGGDTHQFAGVVVPLGGNDVCKSLHSLLQ